MLWWNLWLPQNIYVALVGWMCMDILENEGVFEIVLQYLNYSNDVCSLVLLTAPHNLLEHNLLRVDCQMNEKSS